MPLSPFSSAALSKVVSETISAASLPAGHTNAVVLATDTSGVKFVALAVLGDKQQWTIKGAIEHDWDGNNVAGGSVAYSW